MKRVPLEQEFHGEPVPCDREWLTGPDSKDEVVLDVVGGTVAFIATGDVRDDELLEHNLSERFLCCNLRLENGAELCLWISQDSNDLDVRFVPAKKKMTRAVSSAR